MNVQVNIGENDDGLAVEELLIDGKYKAFAAPLCESPEDATLERSLIGPSTIVEYMKLAYEEGKAGREIIFSVGEID